MLGKFTSSHIFLIPHWGPFVFAILTITLFLYGIEARIESLWLQKLKIENIFVGDASYAAFYAHRDENINLKSVVMIGGSVTREASLRDDEMEQLFYTKSGQHFQFLNLGSSDQSLLESAAILKTLNLAPGSIVFIQISFKKLTYSRENLREEYFRPRMAMLDYSMLNSFLSYSDIFMRLITPKIILNRNPFHNMEKEKKCGHVDLLFDSSACYYANEVIRHKYEKVETLSLDSKKKLANNMENTMLPAYLKNNQFSSQVLREIVTQLKAINVTPILIEYPVSEVERPLDLHVRSETDYLQKIAVLFSDVIYLDWALDPDFKVEDFVDLQHMLISGKQKLSNKLLNYIESNFFIKEICNEHSSCS
ncbi:MAG: hypothetical protein V4660_15315 [Pseudomonadota bacterium]